ncbi:MAG: YraN family protein [Muribaculaceae bacterium]|nr:YraN family protein [Muribaculaceae bacterium]
MARHNSLGKWGERVVTDYLVAEGYAIVESNWRLNHLEVDIIASKGDEIVFVEVKSRRDSDVDPLLAITPAKIRHLVAAANAYLRTCRVPLRPRFDVAAVTGDEHNFKLRYVADAFLPPLRTYR